MCGIAGIVGGDRKSIDAHEDVAQDLSLMLAAMNRRGPDGWGIKVIEQGVLGHSRLAIVDLSGGRQPMVNEAGTNYLVANGEIYNHAAVRWDLRHSHSFATGSDSEAILHLYEELGTDCVHSLDGMFALAILAPDHVFLARDPLGIKPLYYGTDRHGRLCFASEIKSLLLAAEEVRELPPGCWYHSGQGLHRYYELPEPDFPELDDDDVDETTERVGRVLEASVQKRLMADVPVGVFLSGGLDSSLIAAIARRHTAGKLHSFAVGMTGSADLQAARLVAEHLGTEHHELAFKPEDITRLLPEVIYRLESFDPALVRSAVPNFMISEMASGYVKVVLSGEGADELFAGYHYLRSMMSKGGLDEELRRIISSLHNTNLQRLDRMTMAHSLEGRVPFLDLDMVKLALGIAPSLKMAGEGLTEKWVLRRLAGDYLPQEIAWRKKEKFAVGTGVVQILEEYAESVISQSEFESGREIPGGGRIRSKEEYLYWKHFKDHYGREEIIRQMGRTRSPEHPRS